MRFEGKIIKVKLKYFCTLRRSASSNTKDFVLRQKQNESKNKWGYLQLLLALALEINVINAMILKRIGYINCDLKCFQ